MVGGAGTTAGAAGDATAGSGGTTGGTASTAGSAGDGTGGGNAGTGGTGGSNTGTADASTDSASVVHDASSDALSIGDAINGTPDGGAYSRAGWTATSVPPFPTGQKAQNQDFKYSNAFDGNNNTRWSIGDTNSPAQTIGDQFTFDMKAPHVFKKIVFWAGGVNGMNGPDPRDYPGALDVSVSTDCTMFGPTIGSGTEAQPGCGACSMPFTITLAQPASLIACGSLPPSDCNSVAESGGRFPSSTFIRSFSDHLAIRLATTTSNPGKACSTGASMTGWACSRIGHEPSPTTPAAAHSCVSRSRVVSSPPHAT